VETAETHPNPKPPYAWWLKDTSRANDYNRLMQKGTQPNQVCSEGYTFLLCMYATGVFFVFDSVPEGPEIEV